VRLLVVEDEPKMADVLRRGLIAQGYAVDLAHNGVDALWSASEVEYDAIVLDAMIPAPDGFEVCQELRRRQRWSPVLMLTARDAVEDRVRGLDVGADDYLAKPFAFAELFARLRALTRREISPRPTVIEVGGLRIDPSAHSVFRGDTPIELSPTEYSLLVELARYPDRVRSRTELIEHVWDFAYDGTSNVVDVYVRYLREKIDRPFDVTTIETVRGVGYRLRSQPLESQSLPTSPLTRSGSAERPATSNPAASNPAASNPAASNPAASNPAASDPSEA
jgi:two-component system, OmpR family, response regulator